MPGMDGFELAKRIRADKHVRDMPVILVNSTDTPDNRRRAVEVGADAFIVKGTMEQRRLVETVERVIGPR